MKHLFAPFVWIDRMNQKAVDAFTFFLMRKFGVKKSRILFAVITSVIVSIISLLSIRIVERNYLRVFISLILFLVCFFASGSIVSECKKYEDTGMDDRVYGSSVGQRIFSFLMTFFIIVMFCQEQDLEWFSLGGFWFFLLLWFYLMNTPNTPPAQKHSASDLARDVV